MKRKPPYKATPVGNHVSRAFEEPEENIHQEACSMIPYPIIIPVYAKRIAGFFLSYSPVRSL